MTYDPYDIHVAFDDLPEYAAPSPQPVISGVDRASHNVLRRLRARQRGGPVQITPATRDTTTTTFQAVIGEDPFADVDATPAELPVYAALLAHFRNAAPFPALVRCDAPDGYAAFRAGRQRRCCADLAARLDALETFVAHHAADHHPERLDALEDACGPVCAAQRDVLGAAVVRAAVGPTPVGVPAALRHKVFCWQDGGEVLGTARFRDARGIPRLVTTAVPVDRCALDALACAAESEIEPVLTVLGSLAQVVGMTTLIPRLCQAASIYSTAREDPPTIGLMSAASRPKVAAAMLLLQRGQQGDRRARRDVVVLGGRDEPLLLEASARLAAGQRDKMRARPRGWTRSRPWRLW